MAKTKKSYQIRVYFSKTDYLEWSDVTEIDEAMDEGIINFLDKDGQEVTVCASEHVIVVTKRETVSPF